MDMILRHRVEYGVVNAVAVEDLVKSIEAHARLLRTSSDVISDLVPGLRIEPKRVSVLHLSQQSPLTEAFALAVFVTYQEELEKEVPQLVEMLTGSPLPDQYDTLVTVLVMLIAIYGISRAFETLFPGRDTNNLDRARKGLLTRAAKMTGVAADRIFAAIEVLFTGRSRRALVGASQKVFAPTRNQPNASIRDNQGTTLITESAVRDAQAASNLPYEVDEDEKPRSVSEFHSDVRIVLHAMDRDRKRQGWAGHCPDLFDERIPMSLEKTLRPDSIFGKDEIRGDILLTSEEDEQGDLQPKEFLLIQVRS